MINEPGGEVIKAEGREGVTAILASIYNQDQTMSRASKITFGVSCAVTLATIIGVHYVQELERETLHQGPIKDAKRVAEKKKLMPAGTDEKKLLNRSEHELQQELRKKYESMQPLSGEVVTQDGERVK
ncbi:PET assembly of cytochrome c oxidase, mitochondrial [Nakaseomyces glabratus]